MKRFFDVVASEIGPVLLGPLFITLAIWIRCDSIGPVFYRQICIGRNNRDSQLLKFRSMRTGSDRKGLITVGGYGPRVTRSGYYIRKYKLDEFPQLINILKGDMGLVSPRPEMRKHVDMYTTEQRYVLTARPDITDYVSTVHMDENRLLRQSSNPDRTYVEDIMPAKIGLNMRCINHPTLFKYFKLIFLMTSKTVR